MSTLQAASSVFNRIVGTEGTVEVNGTAADLRIRQDGEWQVVDPSGASGATENPMVGAFGDVADGLETGEPPELRAERALNATEVIFGVRESARRRGRVEFPLDIEDNPLDSMVEAGAVEVLDESEYERQVSAGTGPEFADGSGGGYPGTIGPTQTQYRKHNFYSCK